MDLGGFFSSYDRLLLSPRFVCALNIDEQGDERFM